MMYGTTPLAAYRPETQNHWDLALGLSASEEEQMMNREEDCPTCGGSGCMWCASEDDNEE